MNRKQVGFWHIPAWVWAIFVALNVAAVVVLWRWYGYSGADGLQAVILTDTLVALLWYASLTKEVADGTWQQVRLSNEVLLRSSRPYVVIECVQGEVPGSHYYYVKNLGLGPAINVVHRYADPNEDDPMSGWQHLGSVSATAQARVPETLYLRLEQNRTRPFGAHRHIVLAESVTGEWTESENLVEDASGRLSHAFRSPLLSTEQLQSLRRETTTEIVQEKARSLVEAERGA